MIGQAALGAVSGHKYVTPSLTMGKLTEFLYLFRLHNIEYCPEGV